MRYGTTIVAMGAAVAVTAAFAVPLALAGSPDGSPIVATHPMATTTTTAPPPTTTTAPPTFTEPTRPSTTATVPPKPPWPERTLAPATSPWSLTGAGQTLYWLTTGRSTGGPGGTPCPVATKVPVRFDLTGASEVRGATIPGCATELLATTGSLWFLSTSGSSIVVGSLDPVTLAVVHTTTFPRTTSTIDCSCETLAAGPGGVLWVTNGATIWQLDATSGAVATQITPVSPADVLAPSPTGSLLYTSGRNPTGYGAAVDEYATHSGALLAHRFFTTCIGPAQLAAGPDGVWKSCRHGMAGSATELSSTGLARVAPPPTPTAPTGVFDHMMGVGVTVSGGVLWLGSTDEFACADPATGVLRGTESSTSAPGNGLPDAATVLAGHLYTFAAGGVASVAVPTACFGG